MLVRFAGPRLEKGGDDLLPVALRLGGRTLGGALSWSTPQPLSNFEDSSIFAGLAVPPDVAIQRQVLADPARLTGEVKVWARLKDGTPLVTAARRGEGQVVLFHITANSDWSNLPISGLFVEMLKRITSLGGLGGAGGDATVADTGDTAATSQAKPPDNLQRCRPWTALARSNHRRRRRRPLSYPSWPRSCRASIIRRATTGPPAARVPSMS